MDWNPNRVALEPNEFAETVLNEQSPKRFVLAAVRGKLAQMIDDRGLKVLFEQRQQTASNSSSEPGFIKIGGILAPSLSSFLKEFSQLRAANRNQGPHHMRGDRINARKSCWTGATNHFRQH